MTTAVPVTETKSLQSPPTKLQKILRRTLVGGTLALGTTGLVLLTSVPQGPAIVAAIALALTVGCALEAGRMGILGQPRVAFGAIAGCLASLAVLYGVFSPESSMRVPDWSGPGRYYGALGFCLLASAVVVLVGSLPELVGKRGPRAASALSVLGFGLWVALPLSGLVPLRIFTGAGGLAAIILLSKVGDIVGYYVGSWIGVTHPFPKLSPNKTTAGCVASLVAGIVAGAALAHFGLPVEGGWLHGAWTGGLLNLAAQAGDLFESRIKRRAEVKDSSALAGASGGVLDVVDSLLFTVPVALCVWPLAFR